MSIFLMTLSQSGPEWKEDAPLEEQSGWAEHAAFMDSLVDAGFIVLGGPLPDRRVARSVAREPPRARVDRAVDGPARLPDRPRL